MNFSLEISKVVFQSSWGHVSIKKFNQNLSKILPLDSLSKSSLFMGFKYDLSIYYKFYH